MITTSKDRLLVKKWVADIFGVTIWAEFKSSQLFTCECILLQQPNEMYIQKLRTSLELFCIKQQCAKFTAANAPGKRVGDLEITLSGKNKLVVWFDYFI